MQVCWQGLADDAWSTQGRGGEKKTGASGFAEKSKSQSPNERVVVVVDAGEMYQEMVPT